MTKYCSLTAITKEDQLMMLNSMLTMSFVANTLVGKIVATLLPNYQAI